MKLGREQVIILPAKVGVLKAPTIFNIETLAFEQGNHCRNDKRFIDALAVTAFREGMFNWKVIGWMVFVFAGMIIADLTGKYIVPPSGVNMRQWYEKMPILVWEELWRVVAENPAALEASDRDMLFRIFMPGCSFCAFCEWTKVESSNRIERHLSDPQTNDFIEKTGRSRCKWVKESLEDYNRLSERQQDLIDRLQAYLDVMSMIGTVAHTAFIQDRALDDEPITLQVE